jgi:hypothetical protein
MLDRPELVGPGANASVEGLASSSGYQSHPTRKHNDTQHLSGFFELDCRLQ